MAIVRTRRIDAGIDMTPLIDVVFQLLIFLMVSSQFIKPDQRVELPTGPLNSIPVDQDFETLVLTITAGNNLLLEDHETSLEELAHNIRDAVSHSGITTLEIRTDQKSDVGVFLQVMEIARSNGILDLAYHKKDADPE
ncbi:MAG: ExbD/TolR family protein [Akkermansiaceae bacterium]